MARRLNKKVAIIGSLILAILIFFAIFFVLSLNKDPQKFIKDAEAILAMEEPDCLAAQKAYGKAYANTKDTALKIDILFKLADLHIANNEWPKAAGCWKNITTLDTKNTEAKLALLNYSYEVANAGNWSYWKSIETEAAELIENELDTSPRMYRIKGQAILEQVKHGQKTDREKAIKASIEALQKAQNLEPNNIDVYKHLSEAVIIQGEILSAKGLLNAIENANKEAEKILKTGIEQSPDSPQAYINFYHPQLQDSRSNPEKFAELEKNLLELQNKFSSSPLPYFELSQLYQLDTKQLNKAIEAVSVARELDTKNVEYALSAANLYYRLFAINQDDQYRDKAIEIALDALTYPDSLDLPGPRARISFMNRFSLHSFLGICYMEKTYALPSDSSQRADWMKKFEAEVHQINQLLGSAENPYAVMWQGRLELLKGDKQKAVATLNAAYKLLTASGENIGDPHLAMLSCNLAKALEDSDEIGAVNQFYRTAVLNGIHFIRPDILLDFASTLLREQVWQDAVGAINFYKENFPANERADNLLISAYLSANTLEQAEELIADKDPLEPNTINFRLILANKKIATLTQQLRQLESSGREQNEQIINQINSDIEKHKLQQTELADKLLQVSPNINEATIVDLGRRYINENNLSKARDIIDNYLKSNPESVNTKVYKYVLAEPDPAKVPAERFEEIKLKVLTQIEDPVEKNLSLGKFYTSKGEIEKAVSSYQEVLDVEPNNPHAISRLFDIATAEKDLDYMDELLAMAKKYNADNLGGKLFQARLDFEKKDYTNALKNIDICLEQRPIFSQGYLMRSRINNALENDNEAIEDAKKAHSLNRIDGAIAKNLAFTLFGRNEKLGKLVSDEQTLEANNALLSAISANPQDIELQRFYAEFISEKEPDKAIAIYQNIERNIPSAENSLRLGSIAYRLTARAKTQKQRQLYLSIAEDSYKKAYELAPENQQIVSAYSELLAQTGKTEEAKGLLEDNRALLWSFYLRRGELEAANDILLNLYKENPKDANTVRGLLLVSRYNKDNEAILKYSDELITIDKTIDNQIIQIETLLDSGLTDKAKIKLASFREKNPDEPRALFFQAWLTAKQGNLDEALKLTNKILEIDSKNPRSWRLRGQINLGLNNTNQAIKDFQKSKTLREDSAVRIDLAKALFRIGSTEDAIVELKMAIEQQDTQDARSLLAQIYSRTGKIGQLETFYQETLNTFPESIFWNNQAANFALNQKKYNEALNKFSRALEISLKANNNQPDFTALDGRFLTLLLSKQYDLLISDATKYIEGPYGAIACSRIAKAKSELGDKAAAVDYFRKALDKAGENQNFINTILQHMNEVVGREETVKWCNEKLKADPDSLPVNLSLFNLYRISGEYNKALKYIDKCLDLASENEQSKLTYTITKAEVLQLAYIKTSDNSYFEKAIKEYESILKKQPNHISVLNNLAYTLAEQGKDMDKALKYAQRAYNALPNNPNIVDTYGYVLMKNKDYNKADKMLQVCLQLFEGVAISAPFEVYEHVGMVKEKLGQKSDSLKAYQQALEVGQNNISEKTKERLETAIERLSKN